MAAADRTTRDSAESLGASGGTGRRRSPAEPPGQLLASTSPGSTVRRIARPSEAVSAEKTVTVTPLTVRSLPDGAVGIRLRAVMTATEKPARRRPWDGVTAACADVGHHDGAADERSSCQPARDRMPCPRRDEARVALIRSCPSPSGSVGAPPQPTSWARGSGRCHGTRRAGRWCRSRFPPTPSWRPSGRSLPDRPGASAGGNDAKAQTPGMAMALAAACGRSRPRLSRELCCCRKSAEVVRRVVGVVGEAGGRSARVVVVVRAHARSLGRRGRSAAGRGGAVDVGAGRRLSTSEDGRDLSIVEVLRRGNGERRRRVAPCGGVAHKRHTASCSASEPAWSGWRWSAAAGRRPGAGGGRSAATRRCGRC